jgi:CheY-like chemotaxis protein
MEAVADALARRSLVAQAHTSLQSVAELSSTGEADLVVVGLRYGVPDLLGLVDFLRRQPATASIPVVVLGEPTEALARGQLMQSGVSEVLRMPLDVDDACAKIAALYHDRIAHGGPARAVRGSFDEMPQIELLRLLAEGRKSGRVSFRADTREGLLQLEQGKIVFATFGGFLGDPAVDQLASLRQADFTYDPDALLMELPNLDRELSVVVQKIESR